MDTESFTWKNYAWKGLPWSKTVLYELHVGTFTPEGTYDGVRARLPYLKELGVTAIELMPLADFAGRRKEFATFPEFADPAIRGRIPDPNAPETAQSAVLDWNEHVFEEHAEWLTFYQDLLAVRRKHIIPLIDRIQPGAATWHIQAPAVLTVNWPLDNGPVLRMTLNIDPKPVLVCTDNLLQIIYVSPSAQQQETGVALDDWSLLWTVVQEE